MTVVERDAPERSGCSFGNAGMIVPSHFIPLAAPGMVALGLAVGTRGADHNRSGAYEADFSGQVDRRRPVAAAARKNGPIVWLTAPLK